MPNGAYFPALAGLAIGIAFIVLFSVILKPDFTLSDRELISKYSELHEVEYFLEKYPEATTTVDRSPDRNYAEISYTIERQVAPPSELYTGINVFGIHVYVKSNHVSLGISCGVYQGVTIGNGLADIEGIDQSEKQCFHLEDNEDNEASGVPIPVEDAKEINFGVELPERDFVIKKGETIRVPVTIETLGNLEIILDLSITSSPIEQDTKVPDAGQLALALDNESVVLTKDNIARGKARLGDNIEIGYGWVITDAGFLTITASPTAASGGPYEYIVEANYAHTMGSGKLITVTITD